MVIIVLFFYPDFYPCWYDKIKREKRQIYMIDILVFISLSDDGKNWLVSVISQKIDVIPVSNLNVKKIYYIIKGHNYTVKLC